MPRIDLNIEVRDDKIHVFSPERGIILDLWNTIIFEIAAGPLLAVGISLEEYYSQVPDHPQEAEIGIEKLNSETGINSKRTIAAIDYLMLRSLSIIQPKLYKMLILTPARFNLRLLMEDFYTLTEPAREKFLYSLARDQNIATLSINHIDQAEVLRKVRWAINFRFIFQLISLMLLPFGTAPAYFVSTRVEDILSPILSLIIFIIALILWITFLIFLIGLLRELIWVRIAEKVLPRSVMVEEINRSIDIPQWFKGRLILSLK